jgi:hypothetical protein
MSTRRYRKTHCAYLQNHMVSRGVLETGKDSKDNEKGEEEERWEKRRNKKGK